MKFLTLLLTLLIGLSCAKSTIAPSINIISKESQGLLVVECDGKGINRTSAESDAKTTVLNRILFTGIPNNAVSDVRLPMVMDESKLTPQQRTEITKITQGAFTNRYFTEVSHVGAAKGSNGKLQRFILKVNYDLFRRELENKGIIRKFGL